jgi:nucleoside-diphosphate-sugar epimerase
MTIFATGITGTIGRHLISKAKSLDIDLATANFKLETSAILEGDSLLHLAGIVGPAKVEENIELSYQVNVSAVGRLGEQFIESNGSKFILLHYWPQLIF